MKRVYPRTHGETRRCGTALGACRGLSPYTRGNLRPACFTSTKRGSIPVHTGKPIPSEAGNCDLWVYPRTHGETLRRSLRRKASMGLSPYTRGNRVRLVHPARPKRSIPVHTGKPRKNHVYPLMIEVYPRTHGETLERGSDPGPDDGLSPYTRGNLRMRFPGGRWLGSIPVHTGKPIGRGLHRTTVKVYPRTHGETTGDERATQVGEGLSPYTRGNRSPRHSRCTISGSIPVHTGKPIVNSRRSIENGVYPRTHGETITVTVRGW